jgi:prepilin signal peptidase PulO-like enzyme (type II secretory pathway)
LGKIIDAVINVVVLFVVLLTFFSFLVVSIFFPWWPVVAIVAGIVAITALLYNFFWWLVVGVFLTFFVIYWNCPGNRP